MMPVVAVSDIPLSVVVVVSIIVSIIVSHGLITTVRAVDTRLIHHVMIEVIQLIHHVATLLSILCSLLNLI